MLTREQALERVKAGGTLSREELDYVINLPGSRLPEESQMLMRACPEWVEEDRQRREASRKRREKHLAELEPEMRPLMITLREMGFEFEWLDDFVNTDQSYPDAIPIFIQHLQKVTHPTLRNIIGRSLTVDEARGSAGPAIVEELRDKGDKGETRWVLANALTVVASKEDVEAMEALLDAEEDADVRERLKFAIKKARRRKSKTS